MDAGTLTACHRGFFAEHVVILIMARFSQQRAVAKSRRMSELGKKSQAARRARREAALDPLEVADLLAMPPVVAGGAIGSIELRSYGSGTVTRWTVLRGARRNNYRLRTPDGRTSKNHGMAWVLDHLRPILLRKL